MNAPNYTIVPAQPGYVLHGTIASVEDGTVTGWTRCPVLAWAITEDHDVYPITLGGRHETTDFLIESPIGTVHDLWDETCLSDATIGEEKRRVEVRLRDLAESQGGAR